MRAVSPGVPNPYRLAGRIPDPGHVDLPTPSLSRPSPPRASVRTVKTAARPALRLGRGSGERGRRGPRLHRSVRARHRAPDRRLHARGRRQADAPGVQRRDKSGERERLSPRRSAGGRACATARRFARGHDSPSGRGRHARPRGPGGRRRHGNARHLRRPAGRGLRHLPHGPSLGGNAVYTASATFFASLVSRRSRRVRGASSSPPRRTAPFPRRSSSRRLRRIPATSRCALPERTARPSAAAP